LRWSRNFGVGEISLGSGQAHLGLWPSPAITLTQRSCVPFIVHRSLSRRPKSQHDGGRGGGTLIARTVNSQLSAKLPARRHKPFIDPRSRRQSFPILIRPHGLDHFLAGNIMAGGFGLCLSLTFHRNVMSSGLDHGHGGAKTVSCASRACHNIQSSA
jgi:hypothetical protein